MAVDLLVGEKAKGEGSPAVIACNDYLRMGPGRSLQKLCEWYRSGTEVPPTKRLNTLKKWSQFYGWQARAEIYDAIIEAEKNAHRRSIMASGLALDYERVVKLKELTGLLLGEVYTVDKLGITQLVQDNVWLPDVKQIGSGEYAERVDITRFNAAIFEQVRGLLDDLAKETGGRKQEVKMEHRGSIGITPDERAQAVKELEEWNEQKKAAALSNG